MWGQFEESPQTIDGLCGIAQWEVGATNTAHEYGVAHNDVVLVVVAALAGCMTGCGDKAKSGFTELDGRAVVDLVVDATEGAVEVRHPE